jgi:hypothetical protein
MPSDNGDDPFRSSRTAPKWLPGGLWLRACTFPLSLRAGDAGLALSSPLCFVSL